MQARYASAAPPTEEAATKIAYYPCRTPVYPPAGSDRDDHEPASAPRESLELVAMTPPAGHASTESTIVPPPPYSLAPAKARRRWREDFYDHFLDGAAGVMYTSFLGLILDDLIALGTGKYKKC